MKPGSGREAQAWMRENRDKVPSPILDNEKGSRAGDVGGSRDSKTRDAKALAFAAEMADAAHDILEHPSLTEQERSIWALHVDDVPQDVIAVKVGCSTNTIRKAVNRIKALMVSQAELAKEHADAPKQEPIPDLEDTIALGARNAHRVIANIHTRQGETPEDVENNERAVRTVLAIRKSEWEYMQRLRPTHGAPEDEVRRVAGMEKV